MRDGYDTLHGGADIDAVADILAWAFNIPPAENEAWVRKAGTEQVRVVRVDGAPAACAMLVPMGQFFGGRRVPMTGIAGVGSAPERRGEGIGGRLMKGIIKELHAAGVALSGLYPATRPLYRSAGYEPAGTRSVLRLPLSRLQIRDRALPLRVMTTDDETAVRAAYRAHAARYNGLLDRGEYIWNRLKTPRGEPPARGFVVGEPGRVDGYVYALEKSTQQALHYDLRLTDVVATTAAAARRLFTFFADHYSLADGVIWHGGPNDLMLQLLPEVGFEVQRMEHWMLRVVDVAAALGAHGYPEGLNTELHLEVLDDLIPANSGRFVLRVIDGRGEVTRGGRGALRLGVRALAPLYSAHLPAQVLAAAGLIEGEGTEVSKAAGLFGGPAPWTADMY